MKFTRTYNFTIVAFLIVIYLALPALSLAMTADVEPVGASVQKVSSASVNGPCGDCPCSSDDQNSDCCDSTFCNCACHAPLGSGLQLKYAPMVVTQSYPDPYWSLQQVYPSIFVPPQNIS